MHTHAFLFRQLPGLWGNLATIPEATEQCKIFLTTKKNVLKYICKTNLSALKENMS
jgi:hypothetical protein